MDAPELSKMEAHATAATNDIDSPALPAPHVVVLPSLSMPNATNAAAAAATRSQKKPTLLNKGLKYVNETRELHVLQRCNACFAFILARKTIVVKELSVKERPTS